MEPSDAAPVALPEPAAAIELVALDVPATPPRWFAALQVLLVCGIPTQLVVFGLLLTSGSHMTPDGSLTTDSSKISLEFFATASLFDTALVAILIRAFLALSGERSDSVFLGRRPVIGEMLRGLALVPVLLAAVIGLVSALDAVFPGLHNVPDNPLAAYMDTPFQAAVFVVVVILAGGVREELQRGFILHRFEQRLGGARVGLVVFSAAFGLFHLPQGFDAAVAVGTLGVLWGLLYIRRRSVVMSMVSHAGFDVTEVLQQVLLRGLR